MAGLHGMIQRFDRWWGLALAVLVIAGDTALARALGVRFGIGGRDATVLVGVFFGSSFALLGYLLGYVAEGQRHAREAASLIQQQADAIAATRARLAQSEKLATLGQLATAIAHEVRNPLAVIRSAAQSLAESAAPAAEESRRACTFIIEEIDRLSNVVTSLLAFARPLQVDARPVAVVDLLARARLLAGDELAAKAVVLRCETPADLPPVRADADLLCQVLLGLLANAREAVPAGGEVSLAARRAGAAVEIDVADSGPGVPPAMRAQIFEAFFTTRPRGTGLGLAVARQIVEAHGGRIAVGERPGGGARFTLTLPVAAGVVAAA